MSVILGFLFGLINTSLLHLIKIIERHGIDIFSWKFFIIVKDDIISVGIVISVVIIIIGIFLMNLFKKLERGSNISIK